MIVIGGLGSVGGAALGAAFVTALPLLLTHYSDSIPLLAEPGSGGVDPAVAGQFAYGMAVIAVIVIDPAGLASMARRITDRQLRRPVSTTPTRTPGAGERERTPKGIPNEYPHPGNGERTARPDAAGNRLQLEGREQ
jgi:branched-chain amino acid transport system permease protein